MRPGVSRSVQRSRGTADQSLVSYYLVVDSLVAMSDLRLRRQIIANINISEALLNGTVDDIVHRLSIAMTWHPTCEIHGVIALRRRGQPRGRFKRKGTGEDAAGQGAIDRHIRNATDNQMTVAHLKLEAFVFELLQKRVTTYQIDGH